MERKRHRERIESQLRSKMLKFRSTFGSTAFDGSSTSSSNTDAPEAIVAPEAIAPEAIAAEELPQRSSTSYSPSFAQEGLPQGGAGDQAVDR